MEDLHWICPLVYQIKMNHIMKKFNIHPVHDFSRTLPWAWWEGTRLTGMKAGLKGCLSVATDTQNAPRPIAPNKRSGKNDTFTLRQSVTVQISNISA